MLWLWAGLAWSIPQELEGLGIVPDGVEGVLEVHPVDRGPRGRVLRVVRSIDGVPVEGSAAVWLRPDGTVRAKRPLHDLPLHRGTVRPFADVWAPLRAQVSGRPGAPRLSWRPVGGHLRQVWTVPVGGALLTIDAASGVLIHIEDTHRIDAIASVYPDNPVVDLEPVEVSFSLPATALSDDRMEVFQCRDLQELVPFDVDGVDWSYHICTEVPATEALDGDYRREPVPYPADPGRDEDDFAAPHVFFHVGLGLDWFTELGWLPVKGFDPRLELVVNQRDTDWLTAETATDPTQSLFPYRNAYSTGGYQDSEGNWVPPRLVFGQGPTIDFAYDADVIYHELGHFIVKSQAGPSSSPFDPFGSSVDARALNEGLADYFSSAILGDPVLAEYGAADEPWIRNLDGMATCAADRHGLPHDDGQPFAQGLWSVRSTLDATDARLLDQAVLDSLILLGERATFHDAFDIVPDVVEDIVGAATADQLRDEWTTRGLHQCDPIVVVDPKAEGFVRESTSIPYFTTFFYAPYTVGYAQFVVPDLSAGDTVTVTVAQKEFLGVDLFDRNEPKAPMLVRGSGDRITWTAEDVVTTVTTYGYDISLEVTLYTPDVAEEGTMTHAGTRPYEPEPDRYLLHDHELEWVVTEDGPVVFQFVNPHDGYSLTLGEIRVDVLPVAEPEPTDTGTTETIDDGTTTTTHDDPIAAAPQDDGEEKAGCGCSATGGSGLGWLGLGLLAVGARRRATSPLAS